jgi:hypothetical protein
MSRLKFALKAWNELGPRQLGLYALYRLGLWTGHYQRATKEASPWVNLPPPAFDTRPILKLPEQGELAALLGEPGQAWLLAEAEEIVAGQARLFGGRPAPLRLSVPGQLAHWTAYELGKKSVAGGETGVEDVKLVWEPGRFGWAYALGRAYHLSGDQRFAAVFWNYAEAFLDANPPYLGPHWISSQEAALRVIAFAFTLEVFAASPHTTHERRARLAQAIAAHAGRIPPTLVYARAQNNNHLLLEAAGLYTAGVTLPNHPASHRWRSTGWTWFHRGLQSQIAADGAYIQHSTNYHRLMLQSALWMHALSKEAAQEPFPAPGLKRLRAATRWLLALLDEESGGVPNLGPNDGAYILPLTVCPFGDFRPVLQAASAVFLGECPFAAGLWDEMGLWLGVPRQAPLDRGHIPVAQPEKPLPLTVLRLPSHHSWAYLRAARFTARPGHADQMHLDLWWRGLNVAQDAGTYLYNAAPPWDNSLACTEVHNTITLNGEDQMRRAGRFLYLDWAQAQGVEYTVAEDGTWERLSARHTGYRRLGVIHQRTVTAMALEGHWIVEDALLPDGPLHPGTQFTVCLHWLAPDWPWKIIDAESSRAQDEGRTAVRLRSPGGWVTVALSVEGGDVASRNLLITRAGKLVYGSGVIKPTWGWSSPTYGEKIPALSMRLLVEGKLPLVLKSAWSFADDSSR